MAFLFLGPNRLASPRVNGYLVKASSNPFTFYDSPLPGVNTPWDVMRIVCNPELIDVAEVVQIPTGRYVVPTGRVIATVSIKVPTGRFLIARPPMLDRTDFESWQQRIRLYQSRKVIMREYMKSIKEDHFKDGYFTDVVTGRNLRVQFNKVQYLARVLNEPFRLKNRKVSDAAVQQYPTQSSKSPQPTTNTLALLTQSYRSHLPQTNNQLRASSNARNKAMVQDGKVVRGQNRGRHDKSWSSETHASASNCNWTGHIAREVQGQSDFKEKMRLMQAQESVSRYWIEEAVGCFLAREQVSTLMMMR
ncbi:hypothetical protein Tco_1256479 [Tanacetum coccineum]